jgi:hypothetical protein
VISLKPRQTAISKNCLFFIPAKAEMLSIKAACPLSVKAAMLSVKTDMFSIKASMLSVKSVQGLIR